MRKKLLAFLLFTVFSLSSCANVSINNDKLPSGNGETGSTNTDLPSLDLTPSVDEEIKPTSGLVKGNPEENTLEKEEIYDTEGGLKVPFDIAYPEFMGETLYDQNSLLIKIEDSKAAALPDILKSYNVDSYNFVTKSTNNLSWYKVHFEGYKSNEIINEVRNLHPFIKMVDLNYIYDESNLDYEQSVDMSGAEPIKEVVIGDFNNNPMFKEQWHFNNIGYSEAYEYIKKNNMPQGGAGITVAIIDTGVDIYHEDLKENIWTNAAEIPGDGIDNDGNGYIDDYHGVNIVDPAIEPLDDHGHGTHVAGIVAAQNNNVGVVGVAYNSKIMPIKAADSTGIFTQENIAKAVTYAYMNGADVINMSFGGPNSSMVVEDALKSAYTTSILVASAGNDGYVNEDFENRPDSLKVIPNYPASLSYVIGVTSVGSTNVESAFTNIDGKGYTAQEYEVAAPGENILSTLPNNKYGKLSGTSMSAPVISGMAAILRAYLEDHNKYPTKYIYGQIVGTGSQTSICLGREQHGEHTLTKIANLYNALSIYPKPDVELFNYYIFDNKEFSSLNNGDGKMDAGETIYLMPTLINKRGMSEATIISFDVNQGISQEPSRYVKILQSQINFEGIGTYSTKTLLKLSEDQTSYEGVLDLNNALKFEISKDAPNGINVIFNYQIKYKNGLEATDTTDYYDEGSFYLTFNKGIVLPKYINEDTTLSSDNFYIIKEIMYVQKYVTLNIEEGVQLQFFYNDSNGLYKTNKPCGIISDGIINLKGTKENPIRLFTEQFSHDNYGYVLKGNNTNFINASYCFIDNVYDLYCANLEHCRINYNYVSSDDQRLLNFDDKGQLIRENVNLLHCKTNNSFFDNCAFFTVESCNFSKSTFIIKAESKCQFHGFSTTPYTSVTFDKCTIIKGENSSLSVKISANVCRFVGLNRNDKISDYCGENAYTLYLNLSDSESTLTKVMSLFDELNKNNVEAIDITEEQWSSFSIPASFSQICPVTMQQKDSSTVLVYGAFSEKLYGECNISDIEKIDFNKIYIAHIGKDTYTGSYIRFEDKIKKSSSLTVIIKSTKDISQINNLLIKKFNSLFRADLESSINYIENYENVTPSFSILDSNSDSSSNNFVIDDYKLNINSKNEEIVNTLIFDGKDVANAPTLIDKGTEKTWLKDCWPYVTKMELTDKNGVKKSTFNNEAMTCTLYFNREMDMNTPLRVRFGSSEPYAEYEIPGTWINGTTWQGTYTLDTTIENGTQRFTIEGGAAADDSFLTVQECGSRFKFNIDTTAAQAMAIQGDPTPEGIRLTWMQDDYETLLGYNVYRCETKDGNYVKINKSVIGKDENTFLDTGVEPGKSSWYTFTVVFSDLSESKPAGKTACTAYDTMNPNIYHSPVYQGYTSNDLIINCTITDNIGVTGAKVFYRTKGETQYKSVDMTKNNDRYSAKIPSKDINALGLEYYISATDGTNTITKGSETNPFEVVIKDNSTISNKGDVDGDGSITVKDAYMILKHIGGENILSDEEFRRADLNGNQNLETNEALKILQYINGVISSLN